MDIPFPEIKKPLLAIDFSKFIKGHVDEQYIIFTNGKVGFETPKRILMAISPFWKNMLEGDTSISILEIEEICDKTVELMQLTIEEEKRYRTLGYVKTENLTSQWGSAIVNSTKEVLKDMVFLVGKHDCEILKEVLTADYQFQYCSRLWQNFPIAFLHDVINHAQIFNLSILSGMVKCHLETYRFWSAAMEDFEYFSKTDIDTRVEEEIENFGKCKKEQLFQQCLRYAIYQLKHNGDRTLIEKIEGLEPPARGWNDKIEFERKQKEAFFQVLLELAT